jgi:hypothetical protein
MDTLTIFVTQLTLSVVVFSLLAKWFVSPWLADKPIHVALIALTFPHAMRHIGLSFLVPGLVSDSLHDSFAGLAAYGDFVTGLIALLALFALKGRWRISLPLVWLFNIAGTVDLVNALRQAENVPYLLTTWYIPTFFVPLLLVTHALMFVRLVQHALQCFNSRVGSTPELSPAVK